MKGKMKGKVHGKVHAPEAQVRDVDHDSKLGHDVGVVQQRWGQLIFGGFFGGFLAEFW